jgi:acetylornithine deacetylase/succinyl-diaminopimelate desuccinylase-like protein
MLAAGVVRASGAPPVPRVTLEARLQMATRGNEARHANLVQLFRRAGCDVTEQPFARTKPPNVMCTIPGATARRILVTAHFDMTGPGLGVGDNWGSASLLPSFYESLRATKPEHTIVFIGFSEEEEGLVGARYYLRSTNLDDIDAMINMDGAGMAATRVWGTKSNRKLVRRLRELAKEMHVEVVDSSLDGSGIMDSFPFHERGVPVLSIHGLAPGNYGIPHSRLPRGRRAPSRGHVPARAAPDRGA